MVKAIQEIMVIILKVMIDKLKRNMTNICSILIVKSYRKKNKVNLKMVAK